jgi:hypothetical protein
VDPADPGERIEDPRALFMRDRSSDDGEVDAPLAVLRLLHQP